MTNRIESALNNYYYNGRNNSIKNNISMALLGKAMVQAGTEAGGIINMINTVVPPPASVNEIGGILDVRA